MICASNIDLMCSSHVSSEVQNSSPERLTRCDENSEGGRHQSYIGSNEQYAPNPAGCFCFGDRPRVYTKDKIDMRLFSFFVQTGGGVLKMSKYDKTRDKIVQKSHHSDFFLIL